VLQVVHSCLSSKLCMNYMNCIYYLIIILYYMIIYYENQFCVTIISSVHEYRHTDCRTYPDQWHVCHRLLRAQFGDGVR